MVLIQLPLLRNFSKIEGRGSLFECLLSCCKYGINHFGGTFFGIAGSETPKRSNSGNGSQECGGGEI